jgi:hypothetical protein
MTGSRRSPAHRWRQLSKREQLLTGAALTTVALVIVAKGVLAPFAEGYEHRLAQLDDLVVGITTLAPYANAAYTVPAITNVHIIGSDLQGESFGQQPPVQSLPVILEKLAAQPDLSLIAIQPENPVASDSGVIAAHRLMTITVSGDYNALARFFEQLTATAVPIHRIAVTINTDRLHPLVGIITFDDNPKEGK